MTSIAVAPRPMSIAQKNPRRVPSFMIVRLMGPTGMESSRPLTKPVRPASRMGCNSGRSAFLGRGGSGFVLFLLDCFFDLTADLARDARTNEAIDQVKREKRRQDVGENLDLFVQDENQSDEQCCKDRLEEGAGRAQTEGFETGVPDRAHHHRREEQEHGGQKILPVSEGPVLLIEFDDEQREGSNQAGSRRNREPQEFLAGAVLPLRAQAVEPGEAKGPAKQINRGDEPTQFRLALNHVLQNHAMDQEGGGRAEGNQVRQRIEFAAEGAFDAAHARDPAIEQIEYARQQDKAQRDFDRVKIARGDVGFYDFGQSNKAAEEVAGREEVGEKIDL